MGFREQMEQTEREHEEKIRQILLDKQRSFEDHLALQADPSSAANTVFNLEILKIQLQTFPTPLELNPDQYLQALAEAEQWYVSRGYKYPHPERLREQREHWEKRKVEGK